MNSILITGGTGLLGQLLTNALLQRGHRVNLLSRKAGKSAPDGDTPVKTFVWDVNAGTIDAACLDGVDTIIHLAGESIADGRWTPQRKQQLIDSRTKTIGLLYNLMQQQPHEVKSIISASGVGFYADRGDELMTEDCAAGQGFLAECCIAWEYAVDQAAAWGLRVVKFRTGVVLAAQGGALPVMARPVKLGLGTAVGTGRQWIPWIHWQDAVNQYIFAVENSTLSGTFNMVAPNPATNQQLTQAIARQLHRPFWPIKAPAFVLKLALGEMSTLVLGSTRASTAKLQAAGYSFTYPDLQEALADVLG
jgi:uncharacterized protein (TIGR01777 family)